ncbi:MAG: bifunctional DNA-formamidopyrimidine glycosylase/DNA-(apurinic or apyrimidinic site) lyase [Candidatus Eisenbacteria sp.]|nr:bifunctional DNA-formamidopyrimidine glycosylase/DNA-(apurinic or apyrimidinic site) lyase [Candidatus Eisenbacteria bacterium]
MPELPEVETICRRLREGWTPANGSSPMPALIGRRITGSRLSWARTLAMPSPQTFRRRLRGQRVRAISRRGKFIVLQLSRDVMLVHLRMSGSLLIEPQTATLSPHCRLCIDLGSRWRLVFRNPRKFGRVWLTADPAAILDPLGPEPLAPTFTAAGLATRLAGRGRQIKSLLLDQTFLAGLGNIYTDESLFRAGIHPLRRADTLAPEEVRRLWRVIRQVLREAIRHNGTSFDNVYDGGGFLQRLRVYQRTGEPCRNCGTEIARMLVAQRGTHYCPQCQTLGGEHR